MYTSTPSLFSAFQSPPPLPRLSPLPSLGSLPSLSSALPPPLPRLSPPSLGSLPSPPSALPPPLPRLSPLPSLSTANTMVLPLPIPSFWLSYGKVRVEMLLTCKSTATSNVYRGRYLHHVVHGAYCCRPLARHEVAHAGAAPAGSTQAAVPPPAQAQHSPCTDHEKIQDTKG